MQPPASQASAVHRSPVCQVGWYFIKFPEFDLPEVGDLTLQSTGELLALTTSLQFSSIQTIRSIDEIKSSFGITALKEGGKEM